MWSKLGLLLVLWDNTEGWGGEGAGVAWFRMGGHVHP